MLRERPKQVKSSDARNDSHTKRLAHEINVTLEANNIENEAVSLLVRVTCTSHITRHTSHVTHHTSHVTRHTSHVTRHSPEQTDHKVWQSDEQGEENDGFKPFNEPDMQSTSRVIVKS